MRPSHKAIARSGLLLATTIAFSPVGAGAEALPKQGSTSYTSHYIFHPLGTLEFPGVGKVTALQMIGTTDNTKGDKIFDNMRARCYAISAEAGGKNWIDGACGMTDTDGDTVFSRFDTRELDKAQPDMDCGTHFITGGTGKYTGITGKEPFSCKSVQTPPGEAVGVFVMDIPHNTTWEFKDAGATGAGAGESGAGGEQR